MDLSTVMIGLVLITLLIVPVVYYQVNQKGKESKALTAVKDLGAQYFLSITRYDVWGDHYAIGLDEAQQKLIYVNRQEKAAMPVIIELAGVKRCTVANTNREVNGNRVIDLIELHFVFRDPKPSVSLEFYSREQQMMLESELPLAEKWQRIVSEAIATMPRITA